VADPELAADRVQICALKGNGFRSPQAAGVEQTQESGVGVVFQSFHRYVGGALGEHLGYI
jgi:hypothetical protein